MRTKRRRLLRRSPCREGAVSLLLDFRARLLRHVVARRAHELGVARKLHLQLAAADATVFELLEVLFALEHGPEVPALTVELDGLVGVIGHELLLLSLVPNEVIRVRELGIGHARAEAHVRVLGYELLHRTKVEGT